MTAAKPRVGEKIEEVSFAKVGGGDAITIGQAKDRWTMMSIISQTTISSSERQTEKIPK